MHVPVSLSFSLSDPDQTRMEFRKECFVNLKMCACNRKYAKCRTKADAHDKIGFQYISISLYIGSRGETGGPDPPQKNHKNIEFLSNTGPDPLKFSNLPSQQSTLGHHRQMAFHLRADDGPLLVIFGSSLP